MLACTVVVILAAAGGCAGAQENTADAADSRKAVEMVPKVTPPAIKRAREPINVEQVYYSQFRLIANATRALANQRPGVPDIYFIGFAGDAQQDVFLREIRSVRALFDARFDTQGRSLLLINNPATVETTPIASTHNLLAALDQVSARIDPEEDVLFLFLTSHGTPGELAVEFEPLQLNKLTAHSLRAILDRSGIKWRIIVVSACYSGSFIEPLMDDNTMIITAARADRVSFGCSHENDFTYFGRAYFDEALRKTHSFTRAYDRARQTVAQWEREEDLKPSLPQMHIGNAIRPKLAEIETRLNQQQAAN